MTFRPKYITFDCYGTLTYFRMHEMAFDMYEGQLPINSCASSCATSTPIASTR